MLLAGVGFMVGFGGPVHADLSCTDWMSEAFFDAATMPDVHYCLEAGADVSGRDNEGRTPLHLAASATADANVVAALLRAGADIELTDAEGRRPIHTAAAMGRTPDILTYLLVWGSGPDTQMTGVNCSWRSFEKCATAPLHLAAARPDSAAFVATLLAARALPDKRDELGRSALQHAAANSLDVLSVALLLQGGASVSISDFSGSTPLHAAARRSDGAPEIIAELLAAGASADVGDNNGTSPIMWAARAAPNSAIVETLLEASRNPCVADSQGRTVLTQWDRNTNLERDSVYWALHERCRS